MVSTEIVEVKNGAVVRYPGSYADYVYHLEQSVRKELTAEASAASHGVAAKPAVKAPSDYHLRKQQAAARRKLTGQLQRCEAHQQRHRQEQAALEAELMAHAAAWTPELGARFETLKRLIEEEERRWIQLQEALDALPTNDR